MDIGFTAKTTLKYWVYCLCVIVAFSLIGCRIVDNFQSDSETSGETSSAKLSLTGNILVAPNALSSMSANREFSRGTLLAADLSGYVTVPGAEVWIEELPDFPHQITDKDGKYVFIGLNPGNYHVVSRIKKADNTLMKVRSPAVEIVTSNEVSTVPDLGLTAATKVVSGVLYGADGNFLPVGTVLILWGEKFSVTENGQFTSPALPDDMVAADIVVAQPDVAAPSQPKVVVQFAPEGEATTVEVQVKATEDNYLPIIASLNVKKNGQLVSVDNQIRAADLISLSLNLTNIDRNFPGITYEWDEGRGRFSVAPGNNDSAVWVVPDTSGMATITVKVSAPNRGFFKVFLPVFVDQRVKAPTFVVAFNSQGGSAVSSQTVESGARVVLPANPTRANYTFAGWYRDAELNSQWNFPTDTITAAVTLYARWILSAVDTFTVTFDSQYGSTITSQTVESGAKALAPADPTRANYVFAGWYKDAAYTTQWNFTTDTVSTNLKLYAKWNAVVANTFMVNFDSQPGSAVPAQIVESGAKVREPDAPIRTDYTFAGWFKNAALTTLWNFEKDMVYGSVVLYAKWNAVVVVIPTFTVTFDSQAGSAVASQTIASGAKVPMPTNPTRDGYTFAGWYKDAAYTTLWSFSTDTITSAVTLYAKWQAVIVGIATFTVSFDSQGGSAVTSQTVASGANALEPVAPTRAGYAFAGWYKDAACTILWNFSSDTVSTAVTLYAKWQAVIVDIVTFSVSFNSQGGSVVASQTIASGAKATMPEYPTRAGYTFAGWYKDTACTTLWAFSTDAVTSAVTLYAKWQAVIPGIATFTVSFDSQSGSAVTSQTVASGANALEPVAPTRVNYTFAGWYKDAACTTLWAFSTDTVISAVTLYAKWQAVIVDVATFTLSFNSQGGTTVASQTVASGAKALEPAAPTRVNYTFVGWYSDAALTVPWNFANDTVKAIVNLYAKWTIVQHTLTYTAGANGSITGISPQTVDHGASGTLVTAVPAIGYKFTQWSDGSVTSSRTDTNIGANITATATFVAIDAIFAGANKYAWSENTGWFNFVSTNGKVVATLGANGHLSGTAWCENIGWVKFAADSAVAPYGNTSSTNWGVNLAADGKLTGFAWSENAGWINFGATNADATLNQATGAMSGSAWGENIGWVKFAGTQYGVQFQL